MELNTMDITLQHLRAALDNLDTDYHITGDPTMRFDVVTLKVVISNMEKRRSNALELQQRAESL